MRRESWGILPNLGRNRQQGGASEGQGARNRKQSTRVSLTLRYERANGWGRDERTIMNQFHDIEEFEVSA